MRAGLVTGIPSMVVTSSSGSGSLSQWILTLGDRDRLRFLFTETSTLAFLNLSSTPSLADARCEITVPRPQCRHAAMAS